ncbi:MAG: polar amino acid ABC transporter permease [Pelagibacterium sp. SCN 63-23]|nr:MAG: polar amino acid ABC transporter permease [Pelagibacterium sp. SCN 63-23]
MTTASPNRRPLLQHVAAMKSTSIALYLLILAALGAGAYVGSQSMGYKWQWYRVPQFLFKVTEQGFQWGPLYGGLLSTLQISILAFLLAIVLGLVLATMRMSDLVVGRAVSIGVVELVRNIPLIVLLYVFYYVLGPIFDLDRLIVSILCLAIFHAVTISEIFRSGVAGVARGQWEAAQSIGMSTAQSYRYIVLPQATRLLLPPLAGEMINLLKSSAIVSVIAVAELTTVGRTIITDTFMSFEIWFTIALIYLAVTLLMSLGVARLEKKLAGN